MKSKAKKKTSDAYTRILGALKDGKKAQRRLSELSDAIDLKLPPEEFAELLVKTAQDKEASSKDRMMCLGYIISIKKFHEKNDNKIEDEDLNMLESGQLTALLSQAANLSSQDAQRIVDADYAKKTQGLSGTANAGPEKSRQKAADEDHAGLPLDAEVVRAVPDATGVPPV